jgi:hypothetical protein
VFAEPPHRRAQVEPAVAARERCQQHAGLAELVRAPRVGVARDEDHGALRVFRADDFRVRRRTRIGVDDDAKWIAARDLPHGQHRIVGEDRADADEYGVGAIA